MRFFQEVDKKFIKIPGKTTLPTRADRGSAGHDFYLKRDVTLASGESTLEPTDVKAFMAENEYLALVIRSSIGIKLGILLTNQFGVIDSSYYGNADNDGNIHIPLVNMTEETVTIKKGERIAQGIFQHYLTTNDDAPLNDSREGGFGSSGK